MEFVVKINFETTQDMNSHIERVCKYIALNTNSKIILLRQKEVIQWINLL